MRLPPRRRLPLLAAAVVMLVLLSSVARWQLGLLGFGFVAIGVAVLVQRRHTRSSRAD